MPFMMPPPDVQRRVAAFFGDNFWADFEASYQRVALRDPEVKLTSWYRSPADVVRVHQDPRYRGALETQHGVGIAVDLLASTLARRQVILNAARAEGFNASVYPQRPGYPPDLHVHLATLSDAAWRRSQLRRQVAAGVGEFLNPGE